MRAGKIVATAYNGGTRRMGMGIAARRCRMLGWSEAIRVGCVACGLQAWGACRKSQSGTQRLSVRPCAVCPLVRLAQLGRWASAIVHQVYARTPVYSQLVASSKLGSGPGGAVSSPCACRYRAVNCLLWLLCGLASYCFPSAAACGCVWGLRCEQLCRCTNGFAPLQILSAGRIARWREGGIWDTA